MAVRQANRLPGGEFPGGWCLTFIGTEQLSFSFRIWHPFVPTCRRACHRAGPAPSWHSLEIQGLWEANQVLLAFIQMHRPVTTATLDMDATLIETHKRDALPCYKGFKAYQPPNCWWAEQGAILYSEFGDGDVPAGHEQLRVLKDCLRYLPMSVTKLLLRSDTAGYQEELLLYCGEARIRGSGSSTSPLAPT